MAENFIPGLQQAQNCLVRKRRELPIKGEILVKQGDVVKPDTIVAKAELPGDVQILKIAESLGIESSDVVKGLKVKPGDFVNSGDVLCEHKGLFGFFKSYYRAPFSGCVDYISEALGHLGLRQAPQILSINSYCGGVVSKVDDGYGVEVETYATVVQGIFGVGGERLGHIKVLNIAPDCMLKKEHLFSQDLKSAIVVGGTLPDIGVLNYLAEAGAAGLVVGGIDDKALHDFLGYDIGLAVTGNENIEFSVMVTEGFGNLGISERAIALLKAHDGEVACMNGTTQIRAGAIRPEVLIPSQKIDQVAKAESSFGLQLGSRVRLIRVPYFGMLGKVSELVAEPKKLENGSVARVLKVSLDNGQTVIVPRANAEIIL